MRNAILLGALLALGAPAAAQIDWTDYTAERIVTRTQILDTVNNPINRDWGMAVDGDTLYSVVGNSGGGNFEDFIVQVNLTNNAVSLLGTGSLDAIDTGAAPGDFRPQGNPGVGNGVVTVPTWNGSNAITEIGGFSQANGAFSVVAGPDPLLGGSWGAKHIAGNKWFSVNTTQFGANGNVYTIDNGVISAPLNPGAEDVRVFDVLDTGAGVSGYYVVRTTNQLFRIDNLQSATPSAPVNVTPAGWSASDNIRDIVVVADGVYVLIYDGINDLRVWSGSSFAAVIPYEAIVAAAGFDVGDFPLSPSFEGGLAGRPTSEGGFQVFLSNFFSLNTGGNEGAIYSVTFPAEAASVEDWAIY